MIFLDHSSTTRCSTIVQKTIAYYLESTWGNPHSLHVEGLVSKTAINKASIDIKKFLGTSKGSIIWTFGGTDANTRMVQALGSERGQLSISQLEHKSLDQFRIGGHTIWLDENKISEIIEPRHVLKSLSQYSTVASVMCINNEFGTENPIKEIAKAVHEKYPNVLFHSDCVAAITKVSLDLEDSDIDLISISAHKIYGPKGVGCLWVKDPLVAGRIQSKLYRGTPDPVSIIAFAKAVNEFKLKEEKAITNEQATLFLECLGDTKYQVLGDMTRTHNSTMSIYFEDIDAIALVMELSDKGVYCSHGSACASGEATRVLEAAGYPKEVAMCTVRFSFGQMVTLTQVREAAKITRETIKDLENAEY